MHINDFPTELLEEIFLSSTVSQLQEHLPSPPFTYCRRSPASLLVISKLCKRWRDIALNFAPLWTHLHVVDPQEVSVIQDLEVWMHRARTLPLCLSLRQCQSYDLRAVVAVVTLFLNSLHRCQSFEMFVRTDLTFFCLGNIKRVPSTSLESVNVWCMDHKWKWTDAKFLTNLLFNRRSLRTIRWSCEFGGPLETTPHSWENLRELSTDSVGTFDEFLNALSHCQNLERLKIRGQPYGRGSGSLSVTLPRVTDFSLSLGIPPRAILSHLVLPSLAELEVVLLYRLKTWTPVLDLIERSGVILRKLGVINGNNPKVQRLNQVDLIQILKMPYFQELRILELEEPFVAGHDIIKFLTLPTSGNPAADDDDKSGCYLVHLERICLAFQGTRGVKVLEALRKLTKSRLGVLYDPKSASEHIEITTHIRFSLSIPSR